MIEMSDTESIFFEEFRNQPDSWMNWLARIAPKLAADLGLEADKLAELLTAYVHGHISQLGEPALDFATPANE